MKNIKFIAAILIMGTLMAGCSSKETHENTAGGSDGLTRTEEDVNKDSATDKPRSTDMKENMGSDMADNAENAVGDAGDAAGNVIDDAGNIVEDAGDAVGDAAKGVGDAAKDITN